MKYKPVQNNSDKPKKKPKPAKQPMIDDPEAFTESMKEAGLSVKRIKRLIEVSNSSAGEYERGNDRGTAEDWMLP